MLFSKINLHFVTSNQISTNKKLNLSLTSSLVFLPLEMQQRLITDQSLPHVFVRCLKETTLKPLKSFLQCVCYWYNLLR